MIQIPIIFLPLALFSEILPSNSNFKLLRHYHIDKPVPTRSLRERAHQGITDIFVSGASYKVLGTAFPTAGA